MSKRNTQAPVVDAPVNETPAPEATVNESAYGAIAEAAMVVPPAFTAKTVVRSEYKTTYKEAARARGEKDRASRRANGDWLQKEIQAETISAKTGAFDIERFVEILEANGIGPDRHSLWRREKPSDIGRFRMSGSIVLRGIVGKSGVFRTPDGETNLVELADGGDEAAKAFLAKWAN